MLVERVIYRPILSTENITKLLSFEEANKENKPKNVGKKCYKGVYWQFFKENLCYFLDFMMFAVFISFLQFVICCDFVLF